MKTKLFLYAALILMVLLGCSFFSKLAPSPSEGQPNNEEPAQEISTEGWLLPDPTVGLDTLDSYHQELTVGFRGTQDGAVYEWTNTHRHDVWKKASADFWTLATSETSLASTETLVGTVDQAHYSRFAAGAPCQVWWGEVAEGTGEPQQPAKILPPIDAAKEMGIETVNEIPARHYTFNGEKSGTKVAGDFWLAEPGKYVIRYMLTLSAQEGEQHFEYELTRVNASDEVVYPDGCAAVLIDFPVVDGARNLHRLPKAVDYMISAEPAAISQFYQERLPSQGWTFVAAHDNDPKNMILVFVNKDRSQAASILLSARDSGVWVSAMLRPWESAGDAQ